jgi:hypothetical protein
MKGQFEVQFNWIFILIAGAVILAFFFSIVLKQRTISEEKLALTLANELDAITTGASIAKGAAQRLALPKAGIDFQCSDDCACTFNIGRVSKDNRDKLIFAPHHIEGDDIVFWTLDWNVPFRATNFLFVTNDRVKYFFVNDDSAESQQLVAKVKALLPEQANADFVTLEDVDCSDGECVKNENYVRVKFVFLSTDPNFGGLQLDDSFSDTELAAAHITPGVITFFKRVSKVSPDFDEATSFYAGDATLFAAIFSDDEAMYRCNMQSALGRLSYVSNILETRVNTFREDPLLLDHCSYNTGTIENIGRIASEQHTILNEGLGELQGLSSTLIDENEVLLRQSCPTIY